MRINFATLDDCNQSTGTVIVVDVLLAFTTEAYAFANGATSIALTSTVDEALALKQSPKGSLVMGEVGTLPIPEFDMSNSPGDVLERNLDGKRIIHRTSKGTQGAYRSTNAKSLYVTSFPTASATANRVLAERPDDVTFVITGITDECEGDEDWSCAELMAELLRGGAPDREPYVERVFKSMAGQWFADSEKPQYDVHDLDLATDIDRFDFAMQVRQEGDC